MRTLPSSARLALALLGGALATFGCAPPRGDEPPPVIETEDVGPGLDDELDLSADRKADPRARPAGQLPGSFPEGLPIFEPANISDLGDAERGEYVQFMAPRATDEVRAWYPDALRDAGWSVERESGDALVATRGGRCVRIVLESSGPVTLIRVEY